MLARRNRVLFLDARAALQAAPAVAAVLAEELGESEAWQARELDGFRTLAAGYMLDGAARPEEPAATARA
ncbi:hypothetical protein D3C81_2185200 [compost metagenome]